MKIAVSGIQPTGNIHLGNYLGAITNWLDLQDKFKCIFSIVDLHSITANNFDPLTLKKNIYKTLASYLASNIDPNKSIIFQQSKISAHSQLMWILCSSTQIGKLNRMTQFKDKAGKDKEKSSLGLYSYPVLMASDILLYKADIVPVGEDQLQHIELTNDILATFNYKYNTDFFTKVDPLTIQATKRIMSLRNGQNKMSKSEISDMGRINIDDDDDLIYKKIMKAKTDNIETIEGDLSQRHEVQNLLNLYSIFSNKKIEDLQIEYSNKGFKTFKEDLAQLIIEKIGPISKNIKKYLLNLDYLDKILNDGYLRADEIAQKNLKEINKIIGFI